MIRGSRLHLCALCALASRAREAPPSLRARSASDV